MKNAEIYIMLVVVCCWFVGWLLMDEWRNKSYHDRFGSSYWMHTLTVLLYGVSALLVAWAAYLHIWGRQ